MGMSREDRRPSDELFEWSLKEYERLQLEALPLREEDIIAYKKAFKDSKQAAPDNCRTDYEIKIYNRDSTAINELQLSELNMSSP